MKHKQIFTSMFMIAIAFSLAISVANQPLASADTKFLESAGDSYQGATAHMDITFMGIQDISQAP